jgi:hypothetical protein
MNQLRRHVGRLPAAVVSLQALLLLRLLAGRPAVNVFPDCLEMKLELCRAPVAPDTEVRRPLWRARAASQGRGFSSWICVCVCDGRFMGWMWHLSLRW